MNAANGDGATGDSGKAKPSMSAAGHTYDKGYGKWAKFDIDAALRSVDQEEEEGVNDKVGCHVDKAVFCRRCRD